MTRYINTQVGGQIFLEDQNSLRIRAQRVTRAGALVPLPLNGLPTLLRHSLSNLFKDTSLELFSQLTSGQPLSTPTGLPSPCFSILKAVQICLLRSNPLRSEIHRLPIVSILILFYILMMQFCQGIMKRFEEACPFSKFHLEGIQSQNFDQ